MKNKDNLIKNYPLPLIGFAAYSGTGKTTLLCKIIPLLKKKGLHIGVVKHAHHDFEIDHPEKDSCKLRESGASKLVVASTARTAIIIEHPDNDINPTLEDALKNIHTKGLDLILVEGFKKANIPKIELHRKALNKPFLYPNDPNIFAIAVDHELDDNCAPKILELNNEVEITNFIEEIINEFNQSKIHVVNTI